MLPNVERTPEELNAALQRRMDGLVSDLLVISGLTKRGAALSVEFRAHNMPAICRMMLRTFAALESGVIVTHPWDRSAA